MVGTSGTSSYSACPLQAQCDYQLLAITQAIKNAQQTSSKTSNVREVNLLPSVDIQRTGQSIVIQPFASNEDLVVESLVLTPLFAGSYTQADVAVQLIDSTLNFAGKLPSSDNTDGSIRLCPPVPTLHFSQFSKLPASLRIESRQNAKNVLVLANDILDSDGEEGRTQTPDHPLSEIISQQPDCNIIVVDLQDDSTKASMKSVWHQLRRNVKLHATVSCTPENVQMVRLRSGELTTLVALLRHADIVYSHSAGLTIDALNSSCRVVIGDHPVNLQGHEAHQLFAARQNMAAEQMTHLQAHRIIHSISDLHSLLYGWLRPSLCKLETELSTGSPIIPLYSQSKWQRRSSVASGKAKLRKLHRSPRQFLQDSRHPLLRKLGKS